MIHTTNKKLREMYHEEIRASKDYRARGFPNIAKQEHQHAMILKKKIK